MQIRNNFILSAFFLSLLAGCKESSHSLFTKILPNQTKINLLTWLARTIRSTLSKWSSSIMAAELLSATSTTIAWKTCTSRLVPPPISFTSTKGDFEFKDVTDEASVTGEGMWSNGATVVDINNDGLKDIYVSTSIRSVLAGRRNLFYINQGPNKNGVPAFKEMARDYGLDDTSFSVQFCIFRL